MSGKNVFVIDDDWATMQHDFKRGLGKFDFSIDGESDPDRALQQLKGNPPDAVLLDILFGREQKGKDLLPKINKLHPDTPVIMLTNTLADDEFNQDDYPQAVGFYAKDVLAKNDYSDLAACLKETIEKANYDGDGSWIASKLNEFGFIVGQSQAMANVAKQIENYAPTDLNVLIIGESGTGKEHVASAIHKLSARSEAPFKVVNCTAVARDLIESEMFGHEKGAFTGADQKKNGWFQQANHGTLFLDEVGDMSLDMQEKLLRVLEGGDFQRVGGTETLKSDVRVIAATNKNLQQEIDKGNFRQDLYSRLHVSRVQLPPLRDRKEDIPLFFASAVQKGSRQCKKEMSLSLRGDVKALLEGYNWQQGNVREFENAVARAIANSRARVLQRDDFSDLLHQASPQKASPGSDSDASAQGPNLAGEISLGEIIKQGSIEGILAELEKEPLTFPELKTRFGEPEAVNVGRGFVLSRGRLPNKDESKKFFNSRQETVRFWLCQRGITKKNMLNPS